MEEEIDFSLNKVKSIKSPEGIKMLVLLFIFLCAGYTIAWVNLDSDINIDCMTDQIEMELYADYQGMHYYSDYRNIGYLKSMYWAYYDSVSRTLLEELVSNMFRKCRSDDYVPMGKEGLDYLFVGIDESPKINISNVEQNEKEMFICAMELMVENSAINLTEEEKNGR